MTVIPKVNKYIFSSHISTNYDDWVAIENVLEKIKKTNMSILEVGTNVGSSTIVLGLIAQEVSGIVITIDPYMVSTIASFTKYMKDFGLDNIVKQLNITSEEASKLYKNESFDAIFIDGDHTYNFVKQDIELWYPKLKTGGIMFGHDCEFIVKDGTVNIEDTRYKPFIEEFKKGKRVLYGCETTIPIDDKGFFDIKLISNWKERDIIGLSFNKDISLPVFGIHPGSIMAVSEKFPNASIEGWRVWWIKKH